MCLRTNSLPSLLADLISAAQLSSPRPVRCFRSLLCGWRARPRMPCVISILKFQYFAFSDSRYVHFSRIKFVAEVNTDSGADKASDPSLYLFLLLVFQPHRTTY